MLLKAPVEKKMDWESPEPGFYTGVCVDVIDKGMQEKTYKGETSTAPKVRLLWEIEADRADGTPHLVGKTVTASLAKKAKLREILRNWRGQDLSAAEIDGGFDLERVIGASCGIVMTSFTPENEPGKTVTYVESVLKLAEGKKYSKRGDYKRLKDRDDNGQDQNAAPARERTEHDDVPF